MSEKYNEYEDTSEEIEGEDYLDDFDAGSSVDDENWDDSGENQDYAEPVQKKKSSSSMLLVIFLVVIAGLGFVAYQYGGDLASSEDIDGTMVTEGGVPLPQSLTLPDEPSTSPVSGDGLGAVVEQSGEDASSNFPAEISMQEGIPAQPNSLMTALPGEQVAQPDGMMAGDLAGSPVMGEGAVPSLQPVSDFPSVEDIKKSDIDQPVEDSPVLMQPTQPEMTVAEVPALDLLEQTSPVVDMTPDTAVTLAESPTPVVQDTAPVLATDSSGQDLQQAQSRISELELIVADGEKIRDQSSKEILDMKERISSLEAELARAQERTVPVSPSVSLAQKSSGTAQQVKRQSVRTSPVKAVKSPKWILKSARSGQAVLGRIGNSDLKTISVGERVDGLGTVLSIDRGQNGWVVVGTLDRVTE
ncbi:MAG: hypothetical protein AUJ12_06830 [Alphaproteobacteria bacterium CG1_02_46_17]|nr:MAG: hypothetical protein AUJ12_06830 [Alphaproteobacteria bacterium CG1_02_46_17]